MRTLVSESTADQLLDYLASGGCGTEWTSYADLADWETLYNLLGEHGFVGRLTQDLAGRGLAEVRRAAKGMQLRLSPAGEAFAAEHRDRVDRVLAGLSLCGLDAHSADFQGARHNSMGRKDGSLASLNAGRHDGME